MKLETRLEELLLEEKQLQAALAEMGDGRGATQRQPKAQGRRRRKGARARRGQRREELLMALKDQPGARPMELSGKLGISSAQVSTLLKSVRKEKLVIKRGRGYALRSSS